MIIQLEKINRSDDKPHYVGPGRVREAQCTSVQFLDDNHLIAANYIAQRMHLISLESGNILQTLPTQDGQKHVVTDLMSFSGNSIVTSNCQHKSVSLYSFDGSISFSKSFRIPDGMSGFCHGIKFVPPGNDLICAVCTTGGRFIYFLDALNETIIYKFHLENWIPKDICFINDHQMIVISCNGLASQAPNDGYQAKISLFEFDAKQQKNSLLSEYMLDQGHVDCCQYNSGFVFINEQVNDEILVLKLENNQFRSERKIRGYDYPHGLAISPNKNLLAVANYGNSTIVVSSLDMRV